MQRTRVPGRTHEFWRAGRRGGQYFATDDVVHRPTRLLRSSLVLGHFARLFAFTMPTKRKADSITNGGHEDKAAARGTAKPRVAEPSKAAGAGAGAGAGASTAPQAPEDARSRRCPYLDTISRPRLDFDFERVCSVTLSNQNVYGCLVCGRFFQGRGKSTQAYTHSVQAGHHVFINLHNTKVYCLPGACGCSVTAVLPNRGWH